MNNHQTNPISARQVFIAFGKFVCGYRPDNESWAPEDQQVYDLIMKDNAGELSPDELSKSLFTLPADAQSLPKDHPCFGFPSGWNDCPVSDGAWRQSSGNYYEEGARLLTRDGRIMGNAVVYRCLDLPDFGKSVLVLTDADNLFTFLGSTLEQQFYPPSYVVDLGAYMEIMNAPRKLKHLLQLLQNYKQRKSPDGENTEPLPLDSWIEYLCNSHLMGAINNPVKHVPHE